MALQERQKCKILYLKKILEEHTDEEHAVTVPEMIRKLAEYGIPAERKSVYRDLAELEDFGLPLLRTAGRAPGYYVEDNGFALPELKLLIDAVQASRFITEKKSRTLIDKLAALSGKFQESVIRRQVEVSHRVKTDNESIYYTVDCIHEAIRRNVRIRFQYFDWTPEKKKELRHEGQFYLVSPFALSWTEENYYLIAYAEEVRQIRHYRVDKMLRTEAVEQLRSGHDAFRDFSPAEYARETFGMFGGDKQSVRLSFPEELAGAIIDRFGEEVRMIRQGDTWTVNVTVQISPNFYAWITRFCGRVKILSPQSAADGYRDFLQSNTPD